MLSSEYTAMVDIVKKENYEIVVPYGDVDAIKHALLTLKNDPDMSKRLWENGRRAYETKYDWGIMEKRLVNEYIILIDEKESLKEDVNDLS